MKNSNPAFLQNPLESFLKKPKHHFTRTDILRYIGKNGIQMLNFRYVGGDGRLKTLNIPLQGRRHLESLLSAGERVDGSSLFNFLEPGSSDLYVIPRFRTAFRNPFSAIPAIDILCSFYDATGNPLAAAPENTMHKAQRSLLEKTAYSLDVMGEIEYYLISKRNETYRAGDQRGYHESGPFIKWEKLRCEALATIARCGGSIKYGHSEVGNFSDSEWDYEQHEIEFLPTATEDAADQIIIAKWILRELAQRYRVTVSFAPKITSGKAGSGMHIHMRLMHGNKNITLENGELSLAAKRCIAGILDLAPALSAFGNTIPTSYLRLVPDQEAPTRVCWGKRNRSALIRVPLGWTHRSDMIAHANPLEKAQREDPGQRQTFEIRSPDGSADIYLLIAGLCVGARQGLCTSGSEAIADAAFVDVN
ncbi:MAG: glutamine synthetase family protein, partial [Candidatus Marinimicrobia bacterium]|nr:glutamine synthetase family protein [Candidatus Neomarinimicrobiota bacterium]